MNRVLFVSHSSRLYGAERSLALLIAGLDREAFEPLAVLPSDGPLKERLERDGIEVELIRCPWWVRAAGSGGKIAALFSLPAVLLRELLATRSLCRLIRRKNIDLVLTNTAVILSGARAARKSNRPHIWHVREILPDNPDLISLLPLDQLHRLIIDRSRRVLVNSRATAAPLARHDDSGKLQVVANAVAPLPADSPKADLSSVGIGPEDWVVAWVGSLQPRKAPEIAIRAAAEAVKLIPGFKLLVIGGGRDDYTNRLRRQAEQLGLSHTVVLAGYQPGARQLLTHCRALLMTAPDEPFGRVVAEAMCDGVPVVAVGGGGVTELVDHQVTGLLCPPGDPQALAGQLAHLQGHPEMADALVRAARDKAAGAWAPGRYLREIETAMAAVVEERR